MKRFNTVYVNEAGDFRVIQPLNTPRFYPQSYESFKPDEKPSWHYFYNPQLTQSRRVFYDNPKDATNWQSS